MDLYPPLSPPPQYSTPSEENLSSNRPSNILYQKPELYEISITQPPPPIAHTTITVPENTEKKSIGGIKETLIVFYIFLIMLNIFKIFWYVAADPAEKENITNKNKPFPIIPSQLVGISIQLLILYCIWIEHYLCSMLMLWLVSVVFVFLVITLCLDPNWNWLFSAIITICLLAVWNRFVREIRKKKETQYDQRVVYGPNISTAQDY